MSNPTDIISTPELNQRESNGHNQDGFGYYETIGPRSTQEDALVCFPEIETKEHLSPTEIGWRIWSTHKQLDAMYTETAGSTASSNYYDGEGHIITATLADASAFVVVYDKNNLPLHVGRLNSITHKPTDKAESERVQSLGGYVVDSRVNGIIAVSRAIGDNNKHLEGIETYTEGGFIHTKPNGKKLITPDSRIDVLSLNHLIAEIGADNIGRIDLITTCDGFTDGAEEQSKIGHETYLQSYLQQIANQGLRGEELAKSLVNHALSRWSYDNVSVAVQELYADGKLRDKPVFVGVYDGHGGNAAAHFVAKNLGNILRAQCALSATDYLVSEFSIFKNAQLYLDDHPEQPFLLIDHFLNVFSQNQRYIQNKEDDPFVKAMSEFIQAVIKAKEIGLDSPKQKQAFVVACQNAVDTALETSISHHDEVNIIFRLLINLINWVSSIFKAEPLIQTEGAKQLRFFKQHVEASFHEDVISDDHDSLEGQMLH